jgi:hypothetical protein
VPLHDESAGGAGDACTKHEVLLGNLYADLAPWVDRQTRITARQMRDAINMVERHRGKWDSWVTDTLTPILIRDNKIYLTLGPPPKDPTNYFWSVLIELQQLAATTKLPDVELLLNFADTPVVYASEAGRATGPGLPVFSYCKRDRFLDILVPGYYTPDRVCREYTSRANAAHPWASKKPVAFARYSHFCKRQTQHDEYGRPLPPCARSYFARLAARLSQEAHTVAAPPSGVLLDVAPTNVANESWDPSLDFGRTLLTARAPLPLSEHGAYKYLLDTDGFSSAYKLQQELATNSLVLRHRSPWRAYYYGALHAFVHYVPVWRSSRDDVLRTLAWLPAHDALAERIAANGQHFACTHLTQPGRLCYWKRAIEEYAQMLAYTPTLDSRPRAFPLERLNLMCRMRDGPVVCYYNVHPPGRRRTPLPAAYTCDKPVPNVNGSFEECWYRGGQPAAL